MIWADVDLSHVPDQIASASLLIASVTMLYTVWYEALRKTVETEPSKIRGNNKQLLKDVWRDIGRAVLLFLTALALSTTFLFSSVAILRQAMGTGRGPSEFDPTKASLVIADAFSICITTSLGVKIFQLWSLLKRIWKIG